METDAWMPRCTSGRSSSRRNLPARPGRRKTSMADAADDEVGLGTDAEYRTGRAFGPQVAAPGRPRRVAAGRDARDSRACASRVGPAAQARAEPSQRQIAEDGARRPGRTDDRHAPRPGG